MQPLTDNEVTSALSQLDGWTGDGSGISRTVALPTFPAAIAAVDDIAVEAEAANHHPDIDIRWRTLTLRLNTHDAGGRVTSKDTALAAKIDSIISTALAG